MQSIQRPALDRCGAYRSPVTFPEYRQGRAPANAGRTFPVEVLTHDEVDRLMRACGRGRAGARDRAAITLMYRAGLRIAETIALMLKDIDTAGGMVTILHGKGDRARVVPIDSDALAVLEVWFAHRRELGLTARHPVICTITRPHHGDPVWPSVLREKLKRARARAGIEKRVHPHGLRHTYATELAREGVPVHAIRRLLGHSSLDTTERYIARLHPADLARWINARDPWLTHPEPPATA